MSVRRDGPGPKARRATRDELASARAAAASRRQQPSIDRDVSSVERLKEEIRRADAALEDHETGWEALTVHERRTKYNDKLSNYVLALFRVLQKAEVALRDAETAEANARTLEANARTLEANARALEANARALEAEAANAELTRTFPVAKALAGCHFHTVWHGSPTSTKSVETLTEDSRTKAAKEGERETNKQMIDREYAVYAPATISLWDVETAHYNSLDIWSAQVNPRFLKYVTSITRARRTVLLSKKAAVTAQYIAMLDDLVDCVQAALDKDISCEMENAVNDKINGKLRRGDLVVTCNGNVYDEHGFVLPLVFKRPTLLPPPGLYPVDEHAPDGELKFVDERHLNQLCTYMRTMDLQYGVLSSYCATWLVRLERSDEDGEVHCKVSRPFFGTVEDRAPVTKEQEEGTEPPPLKVKEFEPVDNPNGWSLLQALFFIICLAVQDPTAALSINDEKWETVQNERQQQRLNVDGRVGATTRDMTKSAANGLSSAMNALSLSKVSSRSANRDDKAPMFEMTLDWDDRKIRPAMYKDGLVLLDQKLDDGAPCVVKFVTLHAAGEGAIRDLRREIEAYEALAALQGDVLPRMLFGGEDQFIAGRRQLHTRLVLVTSDEGETLYGSRGASAAVEMGTEAFTAAAVAALQRLHDAGWMHGDVAKRNLVIDPATHAVKLIDLGHTKTADTFEDGAVFVRRQAEEMDELRKFIVSFFDQVEVERKARSR